jgi:hypothetical protein
MISLVKAADECLLRINYLPFFESLGLDHRFAPSVMMATPLCSDPVRLLMRLMQ